MVNPKTGNELWFHNTDSEHLDVVVEGLRCFSFKYNSTFLKPWLLVSQNPNPDKVTFVVDLTGIDNADWSLTTDKFGDKFLRVYQDIPAERIRPYADKKI